MSIIETVRKNRRLTGNLLAQNTEINQSKASVRTIQRILNDEGFRASLPPKELAIS